MVLSKKCRYGLRALIDMAVQQGKEPVALNGIAERNGISQQYLEQVFAALRKAGLVRSVKGAQGGYYLKLPASEITMAMIWSALDGTYRIAEEESPNPAGQELTETIQKCVIDEVNDTMDRILQRITLEKLVNDYQERKWAGENMYYI